MAIIFVVSCNKEEIKVEKDQEEPLGAKIDEYLTCDDDSWTTADLHLWNIDNNKFAIIKDLPKDGTLMFGFRKNITDDKKITLNIPVMVKN